VNQPSADPAHPDIAEAAQVVRVATALGVTVAVAESLTAGLVAGTIAAVPGASAVLRGGVVAYATDLKASLLGVDPALLERGGAVQAVVALAMADGVAARLGATYGVGTTGVAGPDPQDGQPPGTVFVAVSGPAYRQVVGRTGDTALAGDRASIRWATVQLALGLLAEALGRQPEHHPAEEHPAEPGR
jgi:nicotinamide-nucleotide amidase